MSITEHNAPSRFTVKSTNSQSVRNANNRRKGVFITVVLVVLVGGGAVLARTLSQSTQGEHSDLVLATVELSSLSVEVTERGNLESANNVEHRCEVESTSGVGGGGGGVGGGTTILWLIEEGKQVKKDELLVELDSSNLQDQEKTQNIAYELALSTYEKAKGDMETAAKTIREHEEGIFIQEEKTKRSALTVEEENKKRAQESARHTETLYRKGFATKEELEAAQFAVISAQLDLENAQLALDVFLKVTKDRTLTQLQGDVESKKAILRAEETKVALEKARLDKVKAQLGKCKIFAKADGMVVYYKPARSWGRQEDQIQEGAAVRERQQLIDLPDLSNMQVRVLVHESKIDWVRMGQPAKIRIDAFAERVLDGHVKSVATAPEQGPWYDQDKRNYPVLVTIDNPIEGLKPGMTSETTILAEKLDDVVTVPVQCVRTVGKKTFCYVIKPGVPYEARTVKLGRSNDKVVQVLEGLAQGEQVVEGPVGALALKEEPTVGLGKDEGSFSDVKGKSGEDAKASGAAAEKKEGDAEGDQAKKKAPPSLMDSDADKDGKVSKQEAPEQSLQYFDQIDTNKDGFIDRSENAALNRRMQQMQQQQGGAGGGASGGGSQ